MLTEKEMLTIEKHWKEIDEDVFSTAEKEAYREKGLHYLVDAYERGTGSVKDLREMILAENPSEVYMDMIEDTERRIEDWKYGLSDESVNDFISTHIPEIVREDSGIDISGMDVDEIKEMLEEIDPTMVDGLHDIFGAYLFEWNMEDLYEYPVLVFLKGGDWLSPNPDEWDKEFREIVSTLEDLYHIEIPDRVVKEVEDTNMVQNEVMLGAIVNGKELFYALASGDTNKLIRPKELFLLTYHPQGSGTFASFDRPLRITIEDISDIDVSIRRSERCCGISANRYSLGETLGIFESKWKYH